MVCCRRRSCRRLLPQHGALRAREQPQGPADLTLKLNYSNMQLELEAAECDRMSRIA